MARSTLTQLDLPWSPKGIVAYEVMSCDLSDPSSDYHAVVVPAFLYYSQIWCARAILTGPEAGDPVTRQEDATSTSTTCSVVFRAICDFHAKDALQGHTPGGTFIELVEPRVYEPLFSTFTSLHSEVPDAGKHDATVNVFTLSWSQSCWPRAQVVWSERIAELSGVGLLIHFNGFTLSWHR